MFSSWSASSGMRAIVTIGTALLTLVLVSACGSSEGKNASTSQSSSSSSASAASKGCGFAFVFEDPVASSSAEQTIERGLKQAEADFHVKVTIIDGSGISSVANNLRAAAAKGCYRAIGTAFFEDALPLTEVAKDYPQQQFYIEGGGAKGSNVTNYEEAAEQGTYVAGAMAAAMSKTHTIGVIDGDNAPPVKRFAAGFVAGAHSVNPSVKVLVNVTNTFTDAALVGSVAVTQAGEGADIIYPASGSNLQVYLLGASHKYSTIGSDLTEYGEAKSRKPAIAFVAASAEGNVNYAIIKQYATGQGKGQTMLGLKDHAFFVPYVADPPTSEFTLPPAVVAAGKKAYEEVVSGKVTVPAS